MISGSEVGSTVSASLPNITGDAVGSTNQTGKFTEGTVGAVKTYFAGPGYVTSQFSQSIARADSFNINASRCSSIYSDSATTITVDSLRVGMYIKY